MTKAAFRTLSIRNKNTLTQTRNAAITAGLALLGMAILAPIAQFGILENIHQHNLYATLENIINLKLEIVLAILILTIVVVIDGVVSIALIKFFKPSQQKLIGLMGWTRIIYAGIFLLAIGFLVLLVSRVEEASSTVSALALSDLKGFTITWDIALVLFGIHLLLLGWLFYKVKYTPTWLGILLALAELGYIVDSFSTYLIDRYTLQVSSVTFIGEVVLIAWLLMRGRRLKASDPKE